MNSNDFMGTVAKPIIDTSNLSIDQLPNLKFSSGIDLNKLLGDMLDFINNIEQLKLEFNETTLLKLDTWVNHPLLGEEGREVNNRINMLRKAFFAKKNLEQEKNYEKVTDSPELMMETLQLYKNSKIVIESMNISPLQETLKNQLKEVEIMVAYDQECNEDVLTVINRSKNRILLDKALIELKHVPYVNLGQDGRIFIAEKLLNNKKEVYTEVEDIIVDLQKEIDTLNQQLILINNSKTTTELIDMIQDFRIEKFDSSTVEIKHQVLSKLIERKTKKLFKSYGEVRNFIIGEIEYLTVDKDTLIVTLEINDTTGRLSVTTGTKDGIIHQEHEVIMDIGITEKIKIVNMPMAE